MTRLSGTTLRQRLREPDGRYAKIGIMSTELPDEKTYTHYRLGGSRSVTEGWEVPRLIRAVRADQSIIYLAPERVEMLKADRRNPLMLFLDFDNEVVFIQRTMSRLLMDFPGLWARVSRQIAVRRTLIRYVHGKYVYLNNGERALISRRQFGLICALSVRPNNVVFKPRANDYAWSRSG